MGLPKGRTNNPKGHCFTIANNVLSKSGIYQIKTPSGKKYIGSASNMRMRAYAHRSKLKNKKHCNNHLQRSYDKHGKATLQPILYCEESALMAMEQACIDIFKPELNILDRAYRSTGYKHDDEARKKMSAAAVIRSKSGKWVNNVSETWFKKGGRKPMGSQRVEDVAHLAHEKTRKTVTVTNIESGESYVFDSILEASKFVGGPNRSCVSHRLRGRLKNEYKGYRFDYAV